MNFEFIFFMEWAKATFQFNDKKFELPPAFELPAALAGG
jgi:hypothetical protein